MDSFNVQELLSKIGKYRYLLLCLLIGLILTGLGILFFKSGAITPSTKVEVLDSTKAGPDSHQDLTAEISGEVIKPGVYKLPTDSRVDDLLIKADGLSVNADRSWCDKYLNRAAKLSDGQKVFIPSVNQQSNVLSAKNSVGDQTVSSVVQSDSNELININTASLSQLDSLPGIGQTYGQNIIEHRPYSTLEELVSKGAIKQSLYNKIKNLISVY
jgi:competence protein ComEA